MLTEQERDLFKKKLDDPSLTWDEVTDVLNVELSTNYSKHHYKRQFYKYYDKLTKNPSELELDDVDRKILELRKEKVKLSDERVQNNAYVRHIAREETLKEIALEVAEKMSHSLPPLTFKKVFNDLGSNRAILQISDWHYGLDFENYWNKYNPEICKQRIDSLYVDEKSFCSMCVGTKLCRGS